MAFVKKAKGDTGASKVKLKKGSKSKEKDESEDFDLPKERSEPEASLGAYVWLLFGEKKIGKTSLTAHMGEAFHAMTESGGKALKLYQRPIRNWKVFKKMVRKLEKTERFDTVVIDIADHLYPFCDDYVCEKLVIQDLAEEEWGKGWREMRKEFEREINRLLNIGIGVVFISHAKEQQIETRDGTTYDRIAPTLHNRMREFVEGVVDIWAYYGYDGRRRVLQILGDDHVSAGHRLEGRFQTPEGLPIRRIDMGRSPKQAYKNITAAFNNEYVPTKSSDVDDPAEREAKKKKSKKLKLKK